MNFNAGDPVPLIKSDASWQTGFTFGFQMIRNDKKEKWKGN